MRGSAVSWRTVEIEQLVNTGLAENDRRLRVFAGPVRPSFGGRLHEPILVEGAEPVRGCAAVQARE